MKTRILTLLLLALLAPVAAQAQFGGGTGAYTDPYCIETTDHWLELADSVNNGNDYQNKLFELYNDLDFSGINFIPIGGGNLNGNNTPFCGIFDGRGHCILNVQVGGNRNIGLFGEIGFGTVQNLTLGGNSRIEGKYFVGGIAGSVGCCDIINCHVEKTVTIAATAYQSFGIGGIIGSSSNAYYEDGCEIRDCTNAATVTNNGYSNVKYVGGIAGEILSDGQSIRNCKNYGAVSGSSDVGGIVGEFNFNWPGNVLEDCYTGGYCTLYGVGQPGSSQGINLEGKAVSMHTITFGENVQGNVTTTPTATFEGENFYAAGMQVSLNIIPDSGTPVGYLARFYLNGVQQLTGNDIEITMPAENVTVTSSNPVRDIGYSLWVSVSLSQESFDYDGSAQVPTVTVTDTKDGTPVTLTEGIDYEVISPANPVSPGIYTLTINGLGSFGGTVTRQYSIMTPDMWPGFGTEAKPYLILTTGHLDQLAVSVNGGNDQSGVFFRLDADLDYSGKPYVTIGTFDYQFKGTFNGNGHSISNVVIQANDDNQALFGCIGAGGSVSGLTLGEGSSIEGANYVGGIAARCYGTVINCGTAEGVAIRADSNAGGIVSMLYFGGSIANCQNRADVYSDRNRSGGIVGYIPGGEVSGCINYGSVEAGNYRAGGIAGELAYNTIVKDCVNEGSVSGRFPVGGIIGESGGGISNCLNLGSVVTSYSSNYQIGGIVGFKFAGSASNNYYASACSVGGINGSDVAGQAMRGYAVSVAPANLGAKTTENSFMPAYENGLFHNGKYYVGSIGLYDAAANDELIAEMADICTNLSITVPVVLQGRTLYKTGIWNTICLPFGLSSFAGTPLADATVKELVSSGYNASTGTLTLNFSTVSEIEAGKPYIVRWASGENVENPVFESVTVSGNAVSSVKTDYVDFIGCYSPVSLAAQDRTVLYLGDNSKLYYPSVEVPVNAFRGHFQLKNGLTAGDLPTNGAKAIVLNFGGGTTGIGDNNREPLTNNHYYSVDGVKLNGEPTRKGVYIVNGKKVVK